MSYQDSILIKLRRDYSKDECMMFSLNLIKSLKIESGKDKAYIEELQEQIMHYKDNPSEKRELGLKIKDLENQVKMLKDNDAKLKTRGYQLSNL